MYFRWSKEKSIAIHDINSDCAVAYALYDYCIMNGDFNTSITIIRLRFPNNCLYIKFRTLQGCYKWILLFYWYLMNLIWDIITFHIVYTNSKVSWQPSLPFHSYYNQNISYFLISSKLKTFFSLLPTIDCKPKGPLKRKRTRWDWKRRITLKSTNNYQVKIPLKLKHKEGLAT